MFEAPRDFRKHDPPPGRGPSRSNEAREEEDKDEDRLDDDGEMRNHEEE